MTNLLLDHQHIEMDMIQEVDIYIHLELGLSSSSRS